MPNPEDIIKRIKKRNKKFEEVGRDEKKYKKYREKKNRQGRK